MAKRLRRLNLAMELIASCSLHQALRLLEAREIDCLLHPNPAIVFPAIEIHSLKPLANAEYSMEINLGGLYGVDSPLPDYLNCLTLSDEGHVLKAFLDIFNHHLYRLAYLAWKRYRPLIALEQGDQRYLDYLHAIGGGKTTASDWHTLTMAGILGHRLHNLSGLHALLQCLFSNVKIAIQSDLLNWVAAQQPELGKGYLSNDLLLGKKALLRNCILITLNLSKNYKLAYFMPSHKHYAAMVSLIKRYLPLGMVYRIRIQLDSQPSLLLGKTKVSLGLTTSLGKSFMPVYRWIYN